MIIIKYNLENSAAINPSKGAENKLVTKGIANKINIAICVLSNFLLDFLTTYNP